MYSFERILRSRLSSLPRSVMNTFSPHTVNIEFNGVSCNIFMTVNTDVREMAFVMTLLLIVTMQRLLL